VTALLLDEMLPPKVAQQLVEAGHDVRAISADPSLRGMPDAEVLELATRERRVLVNDNVKDFAVLNVSWAAAGRLHPGMVFVSSKTFPAGRHRAARLASALRRRLAQGRWPAPGQYDFL
jgi:hypothetical protein